MATRDLPYLTCDVFTTAPFTGNPLAVVFGAEGLSTATLQAITREFNYSETTFVLPAEDPSHTRRVRIFTPEEELPFAGHPTVGTAFALVARGDVPVPPGAEAVTVVLGEGVGPVSVRVACRDGVPVEAQLTTAMLPEERPLRPTRAEWAELLSLEVSDILDGDYAPMAVSCGLPWPMVPLASVAAVSRARIRMESWERYLQGDWAAWPFVFAMTGGVVDPSTPAHVHGVDVWARAFLPGAAVPEDPATGSANACLAAYLAARTPRDGTLRWRVAQGVEMGRPGCLSLEVEKVAGAVTAVRVGGGTVLVNHGTMRCPVD